MASITENTALTYRRLLVALSVLLWNFNTLFAAALLQKETAPNIANIPMTASQLFWFRYVANVVYSFMFPFFGMLADGVGRRWVIAVGLAFSFVGSALYRYRAQRTL